MLWRMSFQFCRLRKWHFGRFSFQKYLVRYFFDWNRLVYVFFYFSSNLLWPKKSKLFAQWIHSCHIFQYFRTHNVLNVITLTDIDIFSKAQPNQWIVHESTIQSSIFPSNFFLWKSYNRVDAMAHTRKFGISSKKLRLDASLRALMFA